MLSLCTVKVHSVKRNEHTIANKLEKGSYIKVNPAFIAYVELVNDGTEEFPFYKRITMSDGRVFNVNVDQGV